MSEKSVHVTASDTVMLVRQIYQGFKLYAADYQYSVSYDFHDSDILPSCDLCRRGTNENAEWLGLVHFPEALACGKCYSDRNTDLLREWFAYRVLHTYFNNAETRVLLDTYLVGQTKKLVVHGNDDVKMPDAYAAVDKMTNFFGAIETASVDMNSDDMSLFSEGDVTCDLPDDNEKKPLSCVSYDNYYIENEENDDIVYI